MASDCDVAGPELQPLPKLLLFLLTVSVSELKLKLKLKFHWIVGRSSGHLVGDGGDGGASHMKPLIHVDTSADGTVVFCFAPSTKAKRYPKKLILLSFI